MIKEKGIYLAISKSAYLPTLNNSGIFCLVGILASLVDYH